VNVFLLTFLLLISSGLVAQDSLPDPQALFRPRGLSKPTGNNWREEALISLKFAKDTSIYQHPHEGLELWRTDQALFAWKKEGDKPPQLLWWAPYQSKGSEWLRGLDADFVAGADSFQLYERQWTEDVLHAYLFINDQEWVEGYFSDTAQYLRWSPGFKPLPYFRDFLSCDWRLFYRQNLFEHQFLEQGQLFALAEEEASEDKANTLFWYWLKQGSNQPRLISKLGTHQHCYDQKPYIWLGQEQWLLFSNHNGLFCLRPDDGKVDTLAWRSSRTLVEPFFDEALGVWDSLVTEKPGIEAFSCWSFSPEGKKLSIGTETEFWIFFLNEKHYPYFNLNVKQKLCRSFCNDRWSGIPEVAFVDELRVQYYPQSHEDDVLCDCQGRVKPVTIKVY
jgi:hypothetical protein